MEMVKMPDGSMYYQSEAPKLPDHGIRAVLFDLDGVLIDAPAWHRESFDRALVEWLKLPALTDEDHELNFNGLSTYKKLDILSERNPNNFKLKDTFYRMSFYNRKQQFTKELIEEHCKPLARVIDVIEYVKSLHMKVACVTNCSEETAKLMLEKSNLLQRFDTVVTNGDVNGKVKPHPYPYLLAKYRLGFANQTKVSLAVDDTGKGIMSAIEAGCRTWWLKNFKDLTVMNMMRTLSSYRITI